ncbi:MAG: RsbRD N-terminal domain-containing protein [Proteobacteria bacterium]|nr:RsbRD N-terminal domain-containing protein [Pseudomonadota bacterium]MBU1710919.1 RsbRD N-terminal domain-containing protein [Pseudomonadota bacterium]
MKENKESILGQWIDSVMNTYPEGAHRFLQKQKDQIANPLGHSIKQGLTDLYKIFCGDDETVNATSIIEQLVRIRAVQDFTPSQAVYFVYDLKKIVLNCCRKEKFPEPSMDEWMELDSRVDKIGSMILDLYMESRERIFKVRLNEFARGNHILTDGMPCPSSVVRREKAQGKNIQG